MQPPNQNLVNESFDFCLPLRPGIAALLYAGSVVLGIGGEINCEQNSVRFSHQHKRPNLTILFVTFGCLVERRSLVLTRVTGAMIAMGVLELLRSNEIPEDRIISCGLNQPEKRFVATNQPKMILSWFYLVGIVLWFNMSQWNASADHYCFWKLNAG